ncbi:hypothetical protein L6452_35356 [Arctium lappa]|uniref:Uncharacterized protein n=1 Tax=Arctium lappa TaxID=4217 RepID=A0ACB8Y681_ARCLA|nr:hypothetical protein L6452_35356 [Arctium lappa]
MYIPIWVLLLFSSLITDLHPTTAQNDFWGTYCGGSGNYTDNSDYKQNLDDLLYSFTETNNGFGFYNSTFGQANAAALCRGDIEPETCRRCVDDATRRLRQVCPNQIEAAGWYDACFLTYSNRNRSMDNRIGVSVYGWNRNNISDSNYQQWNQTVSVLLGRLRREAAGGGECTPDLTAIGCEDCLAGATAEIRRFDRRLGVRVYKPSCVVRGGGGGDRSDRLLYFPATAETEAKSEELAMYFVLQNLIFVAIDLEIGPLLPEFLVGFSDSSPEGSKHEREDDDTGEMNSFGLSTIQVATNNFSIENKLGEGGFGPVYKGYRLWKENKGEALIDDRLIQNFLVTEALRWINVALLCVQEDPQDRPTMSTVVFMLEGQWSANLPAPSEPPLSFARFAAALEQTTTTGDDATVPPSIDLTSSTTASR